MWKMMLDDHVVCLVMALKSDEMLISRRALRGDQNNGEN